MITREQLIQEIGCAEPEKQLHKIAQRERLPVHVLRKMIKHPELVIVKEPEKERKETPIKYCPQNQPRIIWTEREIQYAVEAFRRNEPLNQIAFELETSRDTVRKKLIKVLGDEYSKLARKNCELARWGQRKKIELSEDDMERLKDYWVSGVAKNKICGYFKLSYKDLQMLLAKNPDVFKPRRSRRR